MDGGMADALLLLFNTTRMVPGPPSTGVAIAMDGGMDARWALHPLLLFNTSTQRARAHTLRTPKHGGRTYCYGRRCDRRAPSTTRHRNRPRWEIRIQCI